MDEITAFTTRFGEVHQRMTTYDYARVNLFAQFVASICINESNIASTIIAGIFDPNRHRGCVVDYRITYALIKKELLSPRQGQIFDLVVVGQSNKEIARTLGLSEGTVKIHITKLFEKLGVRHRGAVALAGAKLGLSLVPLPRLVT